MAAARRIDGRFVERPWGRTSLAPWFAHPGGSIKIGEVWFEVPGLLIKFLFTSEPLSVQVHPGDDYARLHENSNGKTEMWHVLDAEPGARIALGFREHQPLERIRETALSGEIEDLLHWRQPSRGDTFLTSAGTVHALGAGLTVLEIQQVSDVTYRLYDYNRGRPLHIEKSLAVLDPGAHPGTAAGRLLDGNGEVLVESKYFVTEKWNLQAPRVFPERSVLIPLEGAARIEDEQVKPGEVWFLEEAVVIRPEHRATLVRTYVPAG
jgi:mannose-6-phosphate isomerase